MNKSKNSAAAALGRLGGLATAARMTANERIGRARAAGRAATLRQSRDERRKHAKLAAKAGKGKKVEGAGQTMKCTNMPERNQYVPREYRKGWEM